MASPTNPPPAGDKPKDLPPASPVDVAPVAQPMTDAPVDPAGVKEAKKTKATGTYRNPNGTDKAVVASKADGKGLVNISDPDGGETLVTECPVSKDHSKEGHYTPL